MTVPFEHASSDGYVNATVNVTYSFIACSGEVHIAYSLNEGSVSAGSSYRLDGKTYSASGAPPRPSSIRFAGTVYRGPSPVGSFADGLAGKALGMGCFSGQTQKIANLSDVLGPKPTAAQVTAYLNSLSLQVQFAEVLRNASIESSIRAEQRKAEAEAARQAAEQAKAEKAKVDAVQAAAAKAQAEQAQRASAGGAGGPVNPRPAIDTAAAQKQAEADRLKQLYEQGERTRAALEEQHRQEYLAGQAAAEAERQRQLQAVIDAAPAAMALGASLEAAVDGWDARRRDRAFAASMAKWGDRCFIRNNVGKPKDGLVVLGEPVRGKLTAQDCGYNSEIRFKAYLLSIASPMRIQFDVHTPTFRQVAFAVTPIEKGDAVIATGSDMGEFQRSVSGTVELQPGEYTVELYNVYAHNWGGSFEMVAREVDAYGRPIVRQKAAPAN
ncbi:MAG TPA: hypothetical protein VF138_13250 [Caulobacteraceae bacterium]